MRWISLLRKAGEDFLEDDCLSSAAAIAYYTIFSLPPLLVLAAMIAGAAGVSGDQVNEIISEQVGIEIASGEDTVSANAGSATGGFGILSQLIGAGMLLFSASGIFGQLQFSLNRAWEVAPDPKRGGLWNFITKRLLSAGMVVVIGFLLMVSLILTTVMQQVLQMIPGLSGEEGIAQVVGIVVNEAVALGLATVLFAAMFKVLPDAKMRWADLWVGAAFTAVLFVIGKTLIGWYLQSAHVGSDWGTSAGSAVATLVWVYYSSLIVLFGAEFTQAWITHQGHGIEPAPGAVRTVEEKRQIRSPDNAPAHAEVAPLRGD